MDLAELVGEPRRVEQVELLAQHAEHREVALRLCGGIQLAHEAFEAFAEASKLAGDGCFELRSLGESGVDEGVQLGRDRLGIEGREKRVEVAGDAGEAAALEPVRDPHERRRARTRPPPARAPARASAR